MTFWTDSFYQSLCDNSYDRIRNHVRFNSHIFQTGYRRRGTIGMKGTYHQVSRDSCFNGDTCGFLVSNLSDHDNVRVLTQDRTKGRSKRKSRFFIYLYLIDTIYISLDRVFYCDNINIAAI